MLGRRARGVMSSATSFVAVLLVILLPLAEGQVSGTPGVRLGGGLRGAVTPPFVLHGQVESVQAGFVHTTIRATDPSGAGLHDGDVLQVALGGVTFAARYFGSETYTRLANDPKAAATLDVDVICTVSPGGLLVLFGTGGELGHAVRLHRGTSVDLVRP